MVHGSSLKTLPWEYKEERLSPPVEEHLATHYQAEAGGRYYCTCHNAPECICPKKKPSKAVVGR